MVGNVFSNNNFRFPASSSVSFDSLSLIVTMTMIIIKLFCEIIIRNNDKVARWERLVYVCKCLIVHYNTRHCSRWVSPKTLAVILIGHTLIKHDRLPRGIHNVPMNYMFRAVWMGMVPLPPPSLLSIRQPPVCFEWHTRASCIPQVRLKIQSVHRVDATFYI